MRTFLATVIGLFSAGFAINGLEALGHQIFPYKFEPESIEDLKNLMLGAPSSTLIAVLVAQALGLITGLFVARLIDRKSTTSQYVIGSLLMLGAVINFLTLPHPMWFIISNVLILLIITAAFTWIANKA